jgi:hypothetical protein
MKPWIKIAPLSELPCRLPEQNNISAPAASLAYCRRDAPI